MRRDYQAAAKKPMTSSEIIEKYKLTRVLLVFNVAQF